MADNPLEDNPEREHRIRIRAYHLWDSEGRPHGRSGEFWERARELTAMEESVGAGQLPNPQATGEDPTLPEGIEEAFLQDNLGEFPGALADQGERDQTPQTHAAHQSDRKAPPVVSRRKAGAEPAHAATGEKPPRLAAKKEPAAKTPDKPAAKSKPAGKPAESKPARAKGKV